MQMKKFPLKKEKKFKKKMKIRKIKKFQYTLLKLNLIKSQIYKKKIQKNNHDDVLNIKTELIELHLKRSLQVIYKYHMNHKKILFIGIPQNFQKKFSKILKNTKHVALPQSIWVNGILSNRYATFRYLYLKRRKNIKKKNWLQNKIIYFLISVIKQPDLIVIFNPNLEKNALNETYKLKLPIVALENNLYFNTKFFYKVPGNFQHIYKKTQHAIFLILASILKKSSYKNNIFGPEKFSNNMFHIKKRRYKPLYKQFIRLRKNVQNRRILRAVNANPSSTDNPYYSHSTLTTKFKKRKWEGFNNDLKKIFKYRKKKFQIYDHFKFYHIQRFSNYFKKKFFNKLNIKKSLSLFYGGLIGKYLKKQINFSLKKITYSRKNFGNTNFFIIKILESRLDSVLHRSFFTLSFRGARQLINHGHVFVNKKIVKISSFILKKGDLVEINTKYHKLILKNIQCSHVWPIPPKYLLINFRTFQILFNENIEATNFSTHFPFRLDISTLIKYYR
jgi:ribosomal protein S4